MNRFFSPSDGAQVHNNGRSGTSCSNAGVALVRSRGACGLAPCICLLTMLVLAACGSRTEYLASELALDRTSWDTLSVDVSFAQRAAIGGTFAIRPDTVVVMLFDEQYDSLYVGPPGDVPVPDSRLGDRERLTIEACGGVKGRQICVQDVVRASPKRLEVDAAIEYPTGSDLTDGRYTLDFRAARESMNGDDWQSIETEGVSGHMNVWVEDVEAREDGIIQIPFTRTNGRFELSGRPNYRDFRFYLDSELLDRDTAYVNFAVYAGFGETPSRLTTVRKEVFWKSDDEREEDIRYLAREAARRLVDELGTFLGGRRAVAYVDEWSFNAQQQRYELELEVEWEGPFFDRGHFELEGVLRVREDGAAAMFEFRNGNRRAERRWESRTDEDVLELGDLGSPAEFDEPNRRRESPRD